MDVFNLAITILLVTLVTLVVAGVTCYRLVRTQRVMREEAAAMGTYLKADIRAYLDDQLTAVQAALQVAAETPKPHRHQWMPHSREETNMQQRVIHTCWVEGCKDTYIEVLDIRTGLPVPDAGDGAA